MPSRCLLLALSVILLASAAMPEAATPRRDTLSLSAAQKKKPTAERRRVRGQDGAGHIACTKYGCVAIPGNCHPQPGFDWRGNPTGYDVIVCR